MEARHALWRYDGSVPSIQVKDVPADIHAALRRRAGANGQSLQEYVLAVLREDARTPTLDELFDQIDHRSGGALALVDAVAEVRADRDER